MGAGAAVASAEASVRWRMQDVDEFIAKLERILDLKGQIEGGGAGSSSSGSGIAGTVGVPGASSQAQPPRASSPVTSVSKTASNAGTGGAASASNDYDPYGDGRYQNQKLGAPAEQMSVFGALASVENIRRGMDIFAGGAEGYAAAIAAGRPWHPNTLVPGAIDLFGMGIGGMIGGPGGAMIGGSLAHVLTAPLSVVIEHDNKAAELRLAMQSLGLRTGMPSDRSGVLATTGELEGLHGDVLDLEMQLIGQGRQWGLGDLESLSEMLPLPEQRQAFANYYQKARLNPRIQAMYGLRSGPRNAEEQGAFASRMARANMLDDPYGTSMYLHAQGMGAEAGLLEGLYDVYSERTYEGALAGGKGNLAAGRFGYASQFLGAGAAAGQAGIASRSYTEQGNYLRAAANASRPLDPVKADELMGQAVAAFTKAMQIAVSNISFGHSVTATGIMEGTVGPATALIGGVGGAAGVSALGVLASAKQANVANIQKQMQDLAAAGVGYDSATMLPLRQQLAQAQIEAAGAQTALAVAPIGGRETALLSTLGTQEQYLRLGYGGNQGALRANILSQLSELNKLQGLDDAAYHKLGSPTEAQESLYTTTRNQRALQVLHLQEEYDQGWEGRLMSMASNLPAGAGALMATFNHRGASFSGIYNRLFGGTAEQMLAARESAPRRFLSAMGAGSPEGMTREAAGAAEVHVTVTVQDPSGKVLGKAQGVTSQVRTASTTQFNPNAKSTG